MNKTTKIERLNELVDKATDIDIRLWLDHEFLSFKWWVLVAMLIIPWLLWAKYVNHNKRIEILLFGTITIVFTLLIDAIGSDLAFWSYPVELVPLGSSGYVFDLTLVPVGFMFVYQRFTNWIPYVIALICFSIGYAFLGEPLMIWLGMVEYVKWRFEYSLIFYILNGIIIKFLIQKLLKGS